MQEWYVTKRQRNEIEDQLLFLEHPPVITIGRGGNRANLLVTTQELERLGIEFFETTRGGDITYHGPGQIIGYPILHLGEGSRDIRKYVSSVEEALVRTLKDFDIVATGSQKDRGVWVGNEKVAAIGVRIARWVTSHGFALNVDPDLSHFRTITPCGLRSKGVTSMSRVAARSIEAADVKSRIVHHFSEVFQRDLAPARKPMHIVKCVILRGDQVLLLKRSEDAGGFWQPVTGRLEPGENPVDAARREVAEETGLAVEPAPLGVTQSFLISEGRLAGTMILEDSYVAKVSSEVTPRAIDVEEHDELAWFSLERALETVKWSDDRESIRAAYARR